MSGPPENAGNPRTLSAADWRAIIAQAPQLFEVISNSMLPVFVKGEQVRIRPLLPGEPLPGQVVAFLQGMIVTHRYLGKDRYRGDNTLTIDDGIGEEQVIGIVSAVVRHGVEIPIRRRNRLLGILNLLRLNAAKFRRRPMP